MGLSVSPPVSGIDGIDVGDEVGINVGLDGGVDVGNEVECLSCGMGQGAGGRGRTKPNQVYNQG